MLRKSRVSKLARGRVGATATAPKWTGPVQITGFGRDERGVPYIGFRVRRGLCVKCVYAQVDQLGPPVFRRLNQAGAHIVSEGARRELIERVQGSNPTDNGFVLRAAR